jgi:hypothetical protein
MKNYIVEETTTIIMPRNQANINFPKTIKEIMKLEKGMKVKIRTNGKGIYIEPITKED